MAAYVIVNTTNSSPNYTTFRDATVLQSGGYGRPAFIGQVPGAQRLPPRIEEQAGVLGGNPPAQNVSGVDVDD